MEIFILKHLKLVGEPLKVRWAKAGRPVPRRLALMGNV